MAKWIENIKNELNLEIKSPNRYYGIVIDYEVFVITGANTFVYINFYGDDALKLQVCKEFEKNSTKLTRAKPTAYGIEAMVNGMTNNSISKALVSGVKRVTEVLSINKIKGYKTCPLCQQETTNTVSIVNNIPVTLCEECEAKLKNQFTKEEIEFNEAPNNYLKGALGAILGSTIAAVLWVVIYLLGYLSAITGVIAVFLSDMFYVKFGGKSNKTKLLFISIIPLIILILACMLMYTYYGNELGQIANSSLRGLEYILSVDEFKRLFIGDMIYNVVFVLIGIIIVTANIYKKNKQERSTLTK